MRTGIAHLPLHYGAAPRWLFQRMVRLAREIALAVVAEAGPQGLLERLADPCWFQAFGCVLGFDWHSSGLTTTVGGALKEGLRGLEGELGFFVAGGKGRTSRKTPQEIAAFAQAHSFDPGGLVYASRMAAKVDNSALQDGYQLYHHLFLFTPKGPWAVVQQGMNPQTRWARRYHWLSTALTDFVCEPHHAICSGQRGQVLNLVAQESQGARRTSAELAIRPPTEVLAELESLQGSLHLPHRHQVLVEDIDPRRLHQILLTTYERQPRTFQELLAIEGVGPKTLRALALISELIYGAPASARDPARFSFAHGGKDGHPYPVDRPTYDRSIELLRQALNQAKVGHAEKLQAIQRLHRFADQ